MDDGDVVAYVERESHVMKRYTDKLRAVQQTRKSDYGLMLAPKLTAMPLSIQRYDDPFLPFSKMVIQATRDLVCAYVFDFSAYFAIGAAGVVALERAIAYARGDGESIAILHVPFATRDYAPASSDTALAVDAVTLTDIKIATAYTTLNGVGAYVVTYSPEDEEVVAQANGADVGYFDVEGRLFGMGYGDDRLRIEVLTEKIIGTAMGEDFEQQIRAEVMAWYKL